MRILSVFSIIRARLYSHFFRNCLSRVQFSGFQTAKKGSEKNFLIPKTADTTAYYYEFLFLVILLVSVGVGAPWTEVIGVSLYPPYLTGLRRKQWTTDHKD